MYHIMLFTNFVPEPGTKELIGYSCCVFLVLGFSVNMTTLIVSPFRLLIRYCRIRYAKKRANEIMKILKEAYIAKQFINRRMRLRAKRYAKIKKKISKNHRKLRSLTLQQFQLIEDEEKRLGGLINGEANQITY